MFLTGWLFDLTGDFRHVFYAIFVISMFSGFLICISSYVKVKPEYSLTEKRRKESVRLEVCTLTGNNFIKVGAVMYETAI